MTGKMCVNTLQHAVYCLLLIKRTTDCSFCGIYGVAGTLRLMSTASSEPFEVYVYDFN